MDESTDNKLELYLNMSNASICSLRHVTLCCVSGRMHAPQTCVTDDKTYFERMLLSLLFMLSTSDKGEEELVSSKHDIFFSHPRVKSFESMGRHVGDGPVSVGRGGDLLKYQSTDLFLPSSDGGGGSNSFGELICFISGPPKVKVLIQCFVQRQIIRNCLIGL
jgi:hypothetical protein